MLALSSRLPFFFNKDNLPPALTAIFKADYPVFFLSFSNELQFITKKKKKIQPNNTQLLKYETFSTLGLKVLNGEIYQRQSHVYNPNIE